MSWPMTWRRPSGRTLLRWLLAAILIASGVGKLLDPSGAVTLVEVAVGQAATAPVWASTLVRAVSLAELTLAGWLVVGRAPRAALAVFASVVALFSTVLLSLPLRGIDVPSCGCFGPLLQDGDVTTALVRNLALLTLGVTGLILGPAEPTDGADRNGLVEHGADQR